MCAPFCQSGFQLIRLINCTFVCCQRPDKKLKKHVITYCHRKKMKGYVMGESYCCMESSSCSTSNRKWFAWRTVNKRTHGANYSISAKQILNCNHPLELGILLAIFCLWHKLRAPTNIILLKEFILFGSLMQEKQFHCCERLLSSGTTCTSPHVGRQRARPPFWVLQGFKKRAGCVTGNASVPALLKIVRRSFSSRGSCVCESNTSFCGHAL